MRKLTVVLALLLLSPPAFAQDEALSKRCYAIYVKLCKGVPNNAEMIGKCSHKYPNIIEKIPAKCQEDFETNVEGYNEVKGLQ